MEEKCREKINERINGNKKERKLLNPKNDYTFKRIFGHKGNEEITKGLLSAILQKEIKKVDLDKNKILEKDLLTDKVGVLDIRATLDDDVNCDIEIQVVDHKDIQERMLYYWSKLYNKGIIEGENYKKLKKVIIILITDYEIEEMRKIEKTLTKWQIREEKYKEEVLTEKLEFYILEIPKYEKYKDVSESLSNWLKFIERPEEMEKKEIKDKNIRRAMDELEGISEDEYEQDMALRREIYLLDQNSMKEWAYEDGKKEGKKEGEKNKTIEIAKKMLKEKLDIGTIEKITGLTKEEIENL